MHIKFSSTTSTRGIWNNSDAKAVRHVPTTYLVHMSDQAARGGMFVVFPPHSVFEERVHQKEILFMSKHPIEVTIQSFHFEVQSAGMQESITHNI